MVDTIWLETRRLLRDALTENDFETWITPVRAVAWRPGVLTIEVPSGFFRDWLKRYHLTALERAAEAAAGVPVAVHLVVNGALAQPAPRPLVPVPAAAAVPTPPCAPTMPARYTFENFVVGAANEVAYNATRAVAAQPGTRFNPLFLYGGVGLGKTHLLFAVRNAIAGAGSAASVACLSAETFVNEMVLAIERRQMERFRRHFRRIGTLIVDDVEFLSGKVRSQEEFSHTFNALYDANAQIVVASDRPPHQLLGIGPTLRSRLACGLLVDVQPPDPALCLALVERKSAAIGLVLSPEIVRYLAAEWCENVRQLEGALTRLDAARDLSGGAVTMSLVRQLLVPRQEYDSRQLIGRIVGRVCRAFQVTRAELTSPRRTARLAQARSVAMYLCRHHTDAALSTIGAEFGGRDHSTVVHALGVIERRLRDDAALRETVSRLESALGS